MDQRDSDPGALLADKGYDSAAIRQDLRDRGASPEIPDQTQSNRSIRGGESVVCVTRPCRARYRTCEGATQNRYAIRQNQDKFCRLRLRAPAGITASFPRSPPSRKGPPNEAVIPVGTLTGLSAVLVQVCPQGLVAAARTRPDKLARPLVRGRSMGRPKGSHGPTVVDS
jgi:hypothetical protein